MTDHSRLAVFDFHLDGGRITKERGAAYGHPKDDFGRIAKLVAALPDYGDPRINHVARMICVKLGRLAATPDHLESLVDIAGYARTWVMLTDKDGPLP